MTGNPIPTQHLLYKRNVTFLQETTGPNWGDLIAQSLRVKLPQAQITYDNIFCRRHQDQTEVEAGAKRGEICRGGFFSHLRWRRWLRGGRERCGAWRPPSPPKAAAEPETRWYRAWRRRPSRRDGKARPRARLGRGRRRRQDSCVTACRGNDGSPYSFTLIIRKLYCVLKINF